MFIRDYSNCFVENLDAPVAFNAYSTVSRQYGDYELVTFDATFLNYGEHFQINNSVFICPVDGLYAFALNVVSSEGSTFIAGRIMIDNVMFTGFYTGEDEINPEAGSAFDIMECFKGQRVWVRTNSGSPYSLSGEIGRSSFSGFLLYSY